MQAAHQRQLRAGTEYQRHFNFRDLEGTNPVLANGDTFATIREMDKWIRKYQWQTASVAKELQGNTLEATCRKVWEFAYRHFQYRPDKEWVEQIRTPLRSWKDRASGIDCDCYSILISTILLNQGIAHKLRKTKYRGGADYQHIYVVVPKPGGGYYTLDPVVDSFNYEEPYTAKYDHPMQIQGLNGIAPALAAPRMSLRGLGAVQPRRPFSFEFSGLNRPFMALNSLGLGRPTDAVPFGPAMDEGRVMEVAAVLGGTTEESRAYLGGVQAISNELLASIRDNLANTATGITQSREVSLYELRDKIRQVLAVWGNAAQRDALIAQFGQTGTVAVEMQAAGVPKSGGITSADTADRGLDGFFDSIGDFFSNVGHAVGQAASWVGNAAGTAAHAVGQAGSWVGNTVANGATAAWGGVSQAAGWVGSNVANIASGAWQAALKAGSWLGQQAVAIGKLILKYNPLSILIRLGLRVAFRVNLFHMSERLGLGYLTAEQAQARKLNRDEWLKVCDRLDGVKSMWNGLQGDMDVLRDSIFVGYNSADATRGTAPLSGLEGLGEAVTGTTATVAASGFIATIVGWLKNINWSALFSFAKSATEVAGLVSSYNNTPVPADTAQMPLSEDEYNRNKAKYDNPPTATSPLLIAAAVGLGTLGLYFALKN